MRKLIYFEWKKIFKSKRNLAIIGIVFLILLVFISSNIEKDKQDREESAKQADFLADWYNKENISYGKSYDKTNMYICKLYSDVAKKRGEYFTKKASTIRANDKEGELQADIAYYEAQLRYYVEGDLYTGSSIWEVTLQNTIYSNKEIFQDMLNYEYQEKGNKSELYGEYVKIPSMLIGTEFQIVETLTYFREKLDFAKQLEKENAPMLRVNEMKGYNFLYRTFKDIFPYMSLIIILLILADIMSTERDYGSYKFLLLQPISRGKVLLAKLVAAVTSAWLIILLPIFLCFLLVGMVNGFGSSRYPVIKSTETYTTTEPIQTDIEYTRGTAYVGDFFSELNGNVDNGYRLYEYRNGGLYMGISEYAASLEFSYFTIPNGIYFEQNKLAVYNPNYSRLPDKVVDTIMNPFFKYVTITTFLLQMLPGVLLYLMFGALLGLCISTVTQHSLISFVMCILIGGGGSVLLSNVSGKIGKFLPFSYGNVVGCMQGLYNRTMLQGILVLVCIDIILYVISYVAFRKRDIIC
jgi:ABC-type transport system involved in multi-copper enzyme maturation permease subunit